MGGVNGEQWGRSTKGMLGRGGEEEVGFLESPEDTLANDLTQEIMDRIWRGLCDKVRRIDSGLVQLPQAARTRFLMALHTSSCNFPLKGD